MKMLLYINKNNFVIRKILQEVFNFTSNNTQKVRSEITKKNKIDSKVILNLLLPTGKLKTTKKKDPSRGKISKRHMSLFKLRAFLICSFVSRVLKHEG